MNINDYVQYGPWELKSIKTNFGWKQKCDIESCNGKSRSQFTIESKSCGFKKTVCASCASHLTNLDVSRYLVAERYIENVKPKFKDLEKLVGMQSISNHQNYNVTGMLHGLIGEFKIIITSFPKEKYMLTINGIKMKSDMYATFKNKTRVTDFAVAYINNRYKDKIFNYIVYGQEFLMP